MENFLSQLEKNKGILYKVSNSYCRDAEDRKDLVQEIIIQLWKAFPKYDPQYKFSTWMYRIALNVSISFYRKERKRKETTGGLSDKILNIGMEEEPQLSDESIHQLYRFINQLNELDKALMLLYLDDHSYQEIAEILGITKTNVATKINRIKEKIKSKWNYTH